jgi:hypothetical protein
MVLAHGLALADLANVRMDRRDACTLAYQAARATT